MKLKKAIGGLVGAGSGAVGIGAMAYDRKRDKDANKNANDLAMAIQGQYLTPEQQLQQLQYQQLMEEAEWNKLMRPQLLKNMGLTEYYTDPTTGKTVDKDGFELDDKGQKVGTTALTTAPKKALRAMTEDEKIAGMTEEEKAAYQTEQLIAEREGKAARGELEVPTYIQDEINRQGTIQNNLLSQRLGAKGASLSTGGINTKVNFLGNAAGTKNAYQYGQTQQGMGLLSGYQNYLGNQTASNQNLYGGFTNAGMGILPMAQTAAQPYTFGRQLKDEKDLMDEGRKNALVGGLMSGVGTAASIYMNKGMGGR